MCQKTMKLIVSWSTLLLTVTLASGVHDGGGNLTLESAIRDREEQDSMALTLSRRKRFLTFPDGSSLQLVLCTQTANVIFAGDIFLYGNTAALAWQLPNDPSYFNLLKDKQGNFLRRNDGVRTIYYTDEKGKFLFKVPYKKRPIVNPAFAKRSVSNPALRMLNQNENSKIEQHNVTDAVRKEMHAAQQRREYLKIEHIGESSVEFHRNSRKDLYEKLEVFLKALGMNGRECLLRTLCETGSRQRDDEQGSFVEEMMRAVFTLPKGLQFDKKEHQQYDKAHDTRQACELQYPGCAGSVANLYV